MQTSFADCFAFTQGAEGGYSIAPADDGNWSGGRVGRGHLIGSNRGVSAPELIAWLQDDAVTAADMRALSSAAAQAIFAAHYWQALRCDDLPAGVDLTVCDMGYNAGDVPSAKLFQRALGFTGEDVDGWIGPDTAAAATKADVSINPATLSGSTVRTIQSALGLAADGDIGPLTRAAIAARPSGTRLLFCGALADNQAAYYRSLKQYPEYGHGWEARVQSRLAASLALLG